jgi:diguanylate cyclase (GGDEF)-like protein/PAS domain S-box-containing protein
VRQIEADSIPCGLVDVDGTGAIVDANPRFTEWTGLALRELVGRPLASLLSSMPAVATERQHGVTRSRALVHTDGSLRPVLVEEGSADEGGRRTLVLFDATDRWAFENELKSEHSLAQRTQTRLELVINASIAFTEAASEAELAYVLAETAASAYSAEESAVFLLDGENAFRQVAGTNPFGAFSDGAELTRQAVALRTVVKLSGIEAAAALSPTVGEAFIATGVQAVIVAPIRLPDQLLGILGVFFHHPRQFDEQASPLADALAGQAARAMSGIRLQRRLEHAAMHDETTGLPNRRFLEDRTSRAYSRNDTVRAVLFVDLDGFKTVNDAMGHQAGDTLLAEVADRLRAAVRDSDLVARYGGDEFVVVCDVASEAAAGDLAERILYSIGSGYPMLPQALSVGASIGISVIPAASEPGDFDRLLLAADQAMYRAKNAGGNQVAFAG